MKPTLKQTLIGTALCAVLTGCLVGIALAGETQYATGSTSAAVTFDPNRAGQTVVKSYSATSDKAASVIKFYATTGNRVPVSSAPSSTTVIPVANTGYGLTNSDTVVYSHAVGSSVYRTLTGATTTNVTLSSAVTATQGASDAIYEVEQIYEVACGATSVSGTGDAIAYTPADSPLYVVVDGTSACKVAVSAAQ